MFQHLLIEQFLSSSKYHLAAEGEESIEIGDNLLCVPEDQNLLWLV